MILDRLLSIHMIRTSDGPSLLCNTSGSGGFEIDLTEEQAEHIRKVVMEIIKPYAAANDPSGLKSSLWEE